ncbi:MAG: RNA pseudouridine synthase [Bacteroidetes bacterium]|nr:MAG: RNA pseudouridine synthase [Bacteroidota bacterium]REK08043.1 MAG: RNA pseudouridine synthase [Bacteroidota bacterium]REK32248.1 MAG: RNA pseudouridine synthase [Bacteroidota bacterium]REK47400.1 MAG: RNA pseudouridine synthase [Bacteroidota bacterium]
MEHVPQILYEDNHLIAVNKRSGDIVQGDKTGDEPLSEMIKSYIKKKYAKPGEVFLGVVHRLDRPVSGVVLFARTSKALSRMNELFREKKVNKIYWAVVKNPPPEEHGTLIHYLVKDEKKNKSRAYDHEVPGSQRCWLDYKVLAKSDNYFLLEVNPLTGRHHQIRVQLSTMGCPIKGDVKYGYDRSNEDGSIHLHSRRTEFLHPVKKEIISLTARVPDDVIWNFFEKIQVND